ncbi:hypothetical protein Q5752_005276 [Cryptotrichosporon argae]
MADVERLLDQVQTAVDAASTSAAPLLEKVQASDDSLDFNAGLSLLLARPHLLLESIHNLTILLALRLHGAAPPAPAISSALTLPFADAVAPDAEGSQLVDEVAGQLVRAQEVLDKVRGMESKLEYQVKKLVGLADEEAKGRVVDEDVEDDLLAFRPNIGAIVETKKPRAAAEAAAAEDDGVYRPPRFAAVPYPSAGPSTTRRDRRAPALLSEFAASLDAGPALESTSGLSVRPASGAHTNSVSAKRAAELKRINEWEEDNMTRLVTSKREAKRRREDEEALAMGFGVGGARNRRRNGLEAELEGVLGERGRRAWDGVQGDLGREERGERGRKADKGAKAGGKRRFEKDVKRRK